jgi:hypothetical protein
MERTESERNGVPDIHTALYPTYVARTESVISAGMIILWLDTAIQQLARSLELPGGEGLKAGELIPAMTPGGDGVRASTVIWAGANNLRHVDEWAASSGDFLQPQTAKQTQRKAQQIKSMTPIARVLGAELPIRELCSFELLQILVTERDLNRGSYDRLELHVLQIGRDLIERAGLADARIGVRVTGTGEIDSVPEEDRFVSDGVARAASSLPDLGLPKVKPAI